MHPYRNIWWFFMVVPLFLCCGSLFGQHKDINSALDALKGKSPAFYSGTMLFFGNPYSNIVEDSMEFKIFTSETLKNVQIGDISYLINEEIYLIINYSDSTVFFAEHPESGPDIFMTSWLEDSIKVGNTCQVGENLIEAELSTSNPDWFYSITFTTHFKPVELIAIIDHPDSFPNGDLARLEVKYSYFSTDLKKIQDSIIDPSNLYFLNSKDKVVLNYPYSNFELYLLSPPLNHQ